jgi:hypothetical protein
MLGNLGRSPISKNDHVSCWALWFVGWKGVGPLPSIPDVDRSATNRHKPRLAPLVPFALLFSLSFLIFYCNHFRLPSRIVLVGYGADSQERYLCHHDIRTVTYSSMHAIQGTCILAMRRAQSCVSVPVKCCMAGRWELRFADAERKRMRLFGRLFYMLAELWCQYARQIVISSAIAKVLRYGEGFALRTTLRRLPS